MFEMSEEGMRCELASEAECDGITDPDYVITDKDVLDHLLIVLEVNLPNEKLPLKKDGIDTINKMMDVFTGKVEAKADTSVGGAGSTLFALCKGNGKFVISFTSKSHWEEEECCPDHSCDYGDTTAVYEAAKELSFWEESEDNFMHHGDNPQPTEEEILKCLEGKGFTRSQDFEEFMNEYVEAATEDY